VPSYREQAVAFLKLAAAGEVQAAFDAYVAPDFIHHNPYFKGDRQSLLDAMAAAHESSPNRSIEIRQVLADGDSVATHSRVRRQDPSQPDVAVVHIFRFADGKIAELWDIGQLLDADSPNEHGAF